MSDVLIVAGDEREAKAWSSELRGADVEIMDAPQALLALKRASLPELVLVDATMPNADGYELCRRLKEQSSKRITILIVDDSSDAREKAHTAGAAGHVSKPVHAPELLRVLESLGISIAGVTFPSDEVGERYPVARSTDLVVAENAMTVEHDYLLSDSFIPQSVEDGLLRSAVDGGVERATPEDDQRTTSVPLEEVKEDTMGNDSSRSWRDDIKSYTDLYEVDLRPAAAITLAAVFGNEDIERFDVDSILWEFLHARGLTKATRTLPDSDDLEWLVPGDVPSPPSNGHSWASGSFDSQDREIVTFTAVKETIGDALGNEVLSATELYSRLWRFIEERRLAKHSPHP